MSMRSVFFLVNSSGTVAFGFSVSTRTKELNEIKRIGLLASIRYLKMALVTSRSIACLGLVLASVHFWFCFTWSQQGRQTFGCE